MTTLDASRLVIVPDLFFEYKDNEVKDYHPVITHYEFKAFHENNETLVDKQIIKTNQLHLIGRGVYEIEFNIRIPQTADLNEIRLAFRIEGKFVPNEQPYHWLVHNQITYGTHKPFHVEKLFNDGEQILSTTVYLEANQVREYNTVYQLEKTIARSNVTGRYEELNINTIPLYMLPQNYKDITFFILNKSAKKVGTLKFDQLAVSDQVSDLTMLQYLDRNDNKTIKLDTKIPQVVDNEVYHWDINSWNFDYTTTNRDVHPLADIVEDDKIDILVSKKGMDYINVSQYCLFTVNGFVHPHEATSNGIYIKNGAVTRNKHRNRTQLGLFDFTQVGKVKQKPITKKMIKVNTELSQLEDNVYIDIGENVGNKTVGIVIGGYFHLLDHTYKMVSSRLLKLDFNNIKWESLFYQMKEWLDVSHLPITDFNDDRVIGLELYHPNTIISLLTSEYSFLVIIDNPNLVVYEEPVGHMGIPKRYESAIPPIYPLRLGEGRYPSYKAIKEKDKWVIAVDNNIVPIQVRYRKPEEKRYMVHNRVHPVYGDTYAAAHYVRIVSNNLVYNNVTKPNKLINVDFKDSYYTDLDLSL